MKKSVICFMGFIFIMMFAITSTTFGADLVRRTLPSTIKLDPSVIKGNDLAKLARYRELSMALEQRIREQNTSAANGALRVAVAQANSRVE